MKHDTMKTLSLGTIGTLATITLSQYNLIVAAIAGTATALFAVFKCIDWIQLRIENRRNKHKRKHKYLHEN